MFKDMTTSPTLRRVFLGCAAILGASCKESSGPKPPGPPAQLAPLTTAIPSAFANTDITTPIQISVRDANGTTLPNQTVTFVVTLGGGILASQTATSNATGTVTVPTWRLGKSAVPQTVRASIGSVTLDISASIATSYNIEVRFFGQSMTAAQQALFTDASARLSGIVTGDVIDANAVNIDIASPPPTGCGITGQGPLNEKIDDVIVYASIRDIDGPGKILAQAGPCLYRNAAPQGQPQRLMPAVGVMSFDQADINTLTGAGSLQEVITHEMLHVLGFGVLWDDGFLGGVRRFVTDSGTANPRYIGPRARQGCLDVSGTVTCVSSIPVEGLPAPAGSRDSHWRESTFGAELMTPRIDPSPNPLSIMTIGSLEDLGYTVNNADADTYLIPGGLVLALRSNNPSLPDHPGWEQLFQTQDILVLEGGKVRRVRRK